jgi:hypothetical protein
MWPSNAAFLTSDIHFLYYSDTSTSLFFKKKVEGIEQHITQLKESEKTIKQKLHQKDQHKKLTIF